MAVILVALVPVFNAGCIVEPGEVFSCENEYAKKLVDNESAKLQVVAVKKAKSKKKPESFDDLSLKELMKIAEKHSVTVESSNTDVEVIAALAAAGVIFDENI